MSGIILVLLRVALGWLMLYSGFNKLMNPDWSAAGYLQGAQTFKPLYDYFISPGVLPIVNALNEWGQTLLGVSLILGAFVRLSSVLGALLMLLYYIPILQFPVVGEHSYIVDEHIIYALILLYFATVGAGRTWGLDKWISKKFPPFS